MPDSSICHMTMAPGLCIVWAMQKTSDLIWQDAQHQVLFDLLDQVAEEDSAEAILHQLKHYAENHFSIEER